MKHLSADWMSISARVSKLLYNSNCPGVVVPLFSARRTDCKHVFGVWVGVL